MKKRLVTFLIGLAVTFNGLGIQGFCDKKVDVSIDNIKNIMLDNSIDMTIMDNNLKNTKQNLDKIKDQIDDIDSEIKNLKNKIEDRENRIDALKSSEEITSEIQNKIDQYQYEIDEYEDQIKDKEKSLDDFDDSKKSAQHSLKTAKLEYEQKVEKAVYDAKKSYIDYLATIAQIDLKNDNLDFKQKQAEAARIKYQYGFISKKEYNNLISDNTDYDYGITETVSSEEIALKNLKLTLGLDQSDEINVVDNIENDMNAVLSIKFEEDLDTMLKNNIEIEIARMKLEWDQDEEDDKDDDDDYENYDLENQKLTFQKQLETAQIDFRQKYNDLMNAYNSLKSSYTKLNDNKKALEVAIKKYDMGFASKNNVTQAKLDVDNNTVDINKQKNEFYLKYLDYTQMKEGF